MKRLSKEFVEHEVSTSTLNTLHLIKIFHRFLIDHYPDYKKMGEHDDTHDLITQIFDNPNYGDDAPDDVKQEIDYQVHEVLFGLIAAIAPLGTTFGSHPGSSADIGFWPNDIYSEFDLF